MTIKTIGTVTITEDTILVEHFHFGPVPLSGSAKLDAVLWAQRRVAEAIVEEEVYLRDRRLVQEVSSEVFGWIDDLKAEYASVDPERVRQIYGRQLASNEVSLDRSDVEDVFIGVALGVYEPEG